MFAPHESKAPLCPEPTGKSESWRWGGHAGEGWGRGCQGENSPKEIFPQPEWGERGFALGQGQSPRKVTERWFSPWDNFFPLTSLLSLGSHKGGESWWWEILD